MAAPLLILGACRGWPREWNSMGMKGVEPHEEGMSMCVCVCEELALQAFIKA